jgi:hypothetical protein
VAGLVSDALEGSFWSHHALLANLAASVIVVMLSVALVNEAVDRRRRRRWRALAQYVMIGLVRHARLVCVAAGISPANSPTPLLICRLMSPPQRQISAWLYRRLSATRRMSLGGERDLVRTSAQNWCGGPAITAANRVLESTVNRLRAIRVHARPSCVEWVAHACLADKRDAR